MKKFLCFIISICLLIAMNGCRWTDQNPSDSSNNSNDNSSSSSSDSNNENTQKAMYAISVPTTTDKTTAEDGTVVFQYTHPHISLTLEDQKVADKIILDFLRRVDSTKETADSVAQMALASNKVSKLQTPYLYHLTYSPARIDNTVLSLFGNNVVFSGGGHPERTCVSASYDLRTGDVLTLASIMSVSAKTDDFCKLVLEGLADMAEGDYLYENYTQTVKQRFTADATQDEAWYFTQSGLCFYFVPYEIAPYSSGVVTVEIPFEKLGNLLHRAYLPVKENATTGEITVTSFEKINLECYFNIAELIADKEGAMYMVSTGGTVQDVRIMLTDYVGTHTVFATNILSQGCGIMVQANQDQLKTMKISYISDGKTNTIPLMG